MFVLMAALEEEGAERLPDGLRLLLLREGVLVVEERLGVVAPIAFIHGCLAARRRLGLPCVAGVRCRLF